MNTIINVKYRDGHGDTWYDYDILIGAITPDQIITIGQNLLESSQVIAHQIGLTSPSREAFEIKGGCTEMDHVYTVLNDFEVNDAVTPSDLITTESASTRSMTVNEFIKLIEEVDFCEDKEAIRIDHPCTHQ
jgi:hypothetical protein